MDLYQIWTTHNRPWTGREMVLFLIVLLICGACSIRSVYQERIKIRQAAAIILLIMYLGIVFGSTVFTRTPTVRQYELVPLWSWKEVLMNRNEGLLLENLLNCILLMPVGILLPIILDSQLLLSKAFLLGVIISAVIELSQLIFRRGLFEWDDMLHNGLGCMVGCLIVNGIIKVWRKHSRHSCKNTGRLIK